MGVSNYLSLVIRDKSNAEKEVHIAFRYGEVREYVYRLGERIFAIDESHSVGIRVVPGAYYGDRNSIQEDSVRYYRIILIDSTAVSVFETTRDDFNVLTAAIEADDEE